MLLAIGLFLAAIALFSLGSPIWWYGFYLAAIFGFENYRLSSNTQHRLFPRFGLKGIIRFYLVTVVTGMVVESMRIGFDLWDYHPILNGVWGVLAFVLFGYFIMMTAMASGYAVAHRVVQNRGLAAAFVVIALVLPAEIANRIVPVWLEPTRDWVLLLFIVGYILEIMIAVIAFNRLLVKGAQA